MPPHNTDDVRIRELKELTPPAHLIREFALDENVSNTIYNARQSMHRILHGMEDRLIVVIGPCSIHDTKAALEYAGRLIGQIYPATHMLTISRGVFSKALDFSNLQSSFWPLLIAIPVILGASALLLKKQET